MGSQVLCWLCANRLFVKVVMLYETTSKIIDVENSEAP